MYECTFLTCTLYNLYHVSITLHIDVYNYNSKIIVSSFLLFHTYYSIPFIPFLLFHTQTQEHTFDWDMIGEYEAEIEDRAFTFTIKREGKDPKWIRVYSPYVRDPFSYSISPFLYHPSLSCSLSLPPSLFIPLSLHPSLSFFYNKLP